MSNAFADLPLSDALLEAVAGFDAPTAIQAAALPSLLDGADVLAQACTGSGKTVAFGLALLQRIAPQQLHPQALVLCPTRELAEQVAGALRQLAKRLSNTRITVLSGGRPLRLQRQALSRGTQVVVGTPGRVVDHLRRGDLDPAELKVLVLDEADRLLDMGFADEVGEVVARTPRTRQTMLFSATYPEAVATLGGEVLRDPVVVRVDSQVADDVLHQHILHCPANRRWETVARLLRHHQPDSALVFCETRGDCERLTDFLQSQGAAALAMHGNMEQRDRDDTWVQLANQSVQVVVATNVAARGLDLDALTLVVIAELSPDPASHIHRIGRTARAGRRGLAVSLVAGDREAHRLARIEAHLGTRIAPHPPLPASLPDFATPRYRTVLVLGGRSRKLRKGDLLGALVKDGGIPPAAIGTITLRQTTCAVAIEAPHAQAAVRYLRRGRVKKARVRAVLL